MMTEDELLLTKVLNCRRVDLYTGARLLSDSDQAQISEMKRRRQDNEPIQYILKSCEFMGLEFFVDNRVLIPRPETELLVESVLIYARNQRRTLRILDIGTGSGNIIISLAKNLPGCDCLAIDISQDALDVARRNARRHGLLEKIHFQTADFLKNPQVCFSIHEKFDIIVSNPPYIESCQMTFLPPDVQREPRRALDGGVDGLVFYRAIASTGGLRLRDQGRIFLEIGDNQQEAIENIFINQGFFVRDSIKDYRQTPRVLVMELNRHG